MEYRIYIERTIRTVKTFEATDYDDVIEKASDIFGDAMNTPLADGNVPDDGDYAVFDELDRTIIGWD